CTDLAIPRVPHRAVVGRIHLPTVVEVGSHHPAAAAEVGSHHPEAGSHSEVAADSFREAVDWSLSSFFLSSETQSIYGVSGATCPPLSLR
ncbi:MAG: hypothetical protein QOC69_3361, partial [Mycobacterium sp.]|nr:hypothetical protein [Mycobacterium sp.]